MYRYVTRRMLLSVPTLVVVSFIIFAMIRINPDSIVAARLGEGYTEEQAALIKHEYRLDRPFATEYVRWVGRVLTGDWGKSAYTFKPVLSEMAPKIAVTLELAAVAVVFAVVIGIPIGVFSAMRQDRWPDYVLRSGAIFGLSVPGFYVATIALAVLANQFQWVPAVEYKTPLEAPLTNISQIWLPAFILSLGTSASVMRFSRTMMLEVLRQDYIRTAWSKGLPERSVIARHALKNAMLPVITIVGLTVAALVGGTVIFETLFTLPGLGTYMVGAVQRKDFAVVQGVTLFFSASVVFINMVVDVSYTLLDPRARR